MIAIYDDDLNLPYFNPSILNPQMDNHLVLNYGSVYRYKLWLCLVWAYLPGNRNLCSRFALYQLWNIYCCR